MRHSQITNLQIFRQGMRSAYQDFEDQIKIKAQTQYIHNINTSIARFHDFDF